MPALRMCWLFYCYWFVDDGSVERWRILRCACTALKLALWRRRRIMFWWGLKCCNWFVLNEPFFTENRSPAVFMKYDDFHTIDWLRDNAMDRQRHRNFNKSRKRSILDYLRGGMDAGSAWLCVFLVGIACGKWKCVFYLLSQIRAALGNVHLWRNHADDPLFHA